MKSIKYLFTLLMALAAISNVAAKKPHDPLCYANGKPIHVADPCVFTDGKIYYLTGTSGADKGFEYYTSTDLKNWEYKGMLYEPGDNDAYKGASCFWAPEVHVVNGKYYLTFSCLSPQYKGLITCLAVSDKPNGKYTDLYLPWIDPKYAAIDCHIFIDDDKQPYLYYSHNYNKDGVAVGETYAAKLKDDLSSIIGEPTFVSSASQPWECVNWEKNRCNEGPWVIKHGKKYVMTYSANDTGFDHYGIGVAEASSPLGPWKKYDDNPLLTTDRKKGISSPGHNSIVQCPDGTLRIVYHRHADPNCKLPNWDRVVCIDKIKFTGKGHLKLQQ